MLDFDAAHRLVPLCFKLLCSLQFYESTKSELYFVHIYQSMIKKLTSTKYMNLPTSARFA